ncbi:MAG: hypothetical protein ABIJ17_00330 [Patescibacteria group bacterium]
MDNIDLLFDDYTTIGWPQDKIHSDYFPYLLIRLAFGIFSLVAISKKFATRDIDELIEIYKDFSALHGYRVCLVLGKHECFYIEPDGKAIENDKPPTGGSIINWWKLQEGLIKVVDITDDRKIFYGKDNDGNDYIIASN